MSLRAAVNAKCRWCIVDEVAAGSAAVQVELCASVDCPLWPVRPIRKDRIPFSLAVVTEYGMTGSEADARLREPRNPSAFGGVAANSGDTAQGEAIPRETVAGECDGAPALP